MTYIHTKIRKNLENNENKLYYKEFKFQWFDKITEPIVSPVTKYFFYFTQKFAPFRFNN